MPPIASLQVLFSRAWMWVFLLLVLILIGTWVLLWIRQLMTSDNGDDPERMLLEFRQLHAQGELSHEEYEEVRRKLGGHWAKSELSQTD